MSIAPPILTAAPDDVLASLSEVERIRLRGLLRERKEHKRRNGIAFYRPHHKQELFHKAASFKYRYARVGNRFGKSEMGAAETVAWLLGERPWVGVGHPDRTVGIPLHPVKGVLICNDWDKSEEIFTAMTADAEAKGKLFRFLPENQIVKVTRNHSGKIYKIDVKGLHGISTLYIDTVQSFKMDPMGHESSDWDFVHIDEPIPRDMWIAYARGMVDRGGSAWFVCTPLSEPWINDFFLPSVREVLDMDLPYEEGNRWVMTGTMMDNPYNGPEEVENFKSFLSEDEAQCRIFGVPTSMAGTVYKAFSPTKHVYYEKPKAWTAFNNPPADYAIRFAIDPHPRTAHAVLFAATAPTGQVFFYDEIFLTGTIAETAIRIQEKLANRNVIYGLCDPLGFIPHPITDTSMVDEFIKYGLALEKAPKDPSNGILQVTEWLKERDEQGLAKMFFSPHLRETLFEFDHYMWDDKRPDKPKDKDDHMMENLYRLVLTGLEYISPTENDGHVIPYTTLSESMYHSSSGPKKPAWASRYR